MPPPPRAVPVRVVLLFDRIVEVCSSAAFVVAQVVLAVMAGMICVEVVCRSFFNFSLLVVDEVVGYLLVAVVFLGLSATFRRRLMLQVRVIYDRLPQGWRSRVDILFNVLCLLFSSLLAWQTVRLTLQSYERGVTSSTMARVPLYIPQTAMSVGALLLVLTIVSLMLRSLWGLGQEACSESSSDTKDVAQ